MTHDQLRTASDQLRQAGEAATDTGLIERLHDLSNQLARLATTGAGPEREQLTQHLDALAAVREQASSDVREHIDAAEAALQSSRERIDD